MLVDVQLIYLLAALGSALAYSAMDLSRKVLLGRVRAMPLLCVLSLGLVPFFLAWWLLAGAEPVARGYWLPGGGSLALNIVSNLVFLEAVRISPFSVTIPMLSLTPVFSTLLGIPLLGEVPTAVQGMGIALVVLGAFGINLGSGDRLHLGDAWRALVRERGSLLMAGVALSWSIALPLDKLAMRQANVPFHGLVVSAGVAAAVFVGLVHRRRLAELFLPRGCRLLVSLSIAASAVAIGLFLVAVANVWIGLVESLKRAIGSAAALILGRALFDEPISGRQVAAVVLMSIGVALILL